MCLSPCKDESMYYYPFEKACYATCQSPYTYYQVEKLKVCKFSVDIDLETVNELKDASESIAAQGNVASGGMKAAGALNSNSPSSALLAGLSSMLQYIRYMQIQYPPKVETMFLISADEPLSISFDFDIPPSIDEKLADYPLPNAFDKYDIDSNFVRNLWDLIGSFLLSVFAILGLMLIVKLFKKLPRIQLILKKFLKIAKWNIPAMMLCSSSGDIFFYAGLHMNVMRLTDFYSVACFLIVLFMVVTTIWLWYLTLKIVKDYKRSKDSASDEDWKDKWDDYQLLFDNSEEKSVLTIAYMTFFILRGFIFNLTIACLYEYPLVQVGIINGSNFLMFGYLLVYRPLKEFLALVQMFVNETLIIILSVSTLILAVMDRLGIKGTATRYTVGEAILFVIKIFNTIGLVFMGIQALLTLVFAFKAFRYFRAKGIKNPLKMIQVVAFEEFEEAPKPSADDEDLKKGERKIKIKRPPRKNIELAPRTESANIMTDAGVVPSITIYESAFENRNLEIKNDPIQLEETYSDTVTNNELITLSTPPIQKSPQPSSLDTSNIENENSQVFILDQSTELLPYNHQQREIDPNFLSPFPVENPRNRGLRRLRFRSRESSRSRLEQEDKASSVSNEDNKASDVEEEQNGLNQSQMTEVNFATETNLVIDSDADRRGNIGDVGDIVESLRKLKERRNRIKRKESAEEATKSWFSGLRKLKQYLKNSKKDEE